MLSQTGVVCQSIEAEFTNIFEEDVKPFCVEQRQLHRLSFPPSRAKHKSLSNLCAENNTIHSYPLFSTAAKDINRNKERELNSDVHPLTSLSPLKSFEISPQEIAKRMKSEFQGVGLSTTELLLDQLMSECELELVGDSSALPPPPCVY